MTKAHTCGRQGPMISAMAVAFLAHTVTDRDCRERRGRIYDATTPAMSDVYNLHRKWFSKQPRATASVEASSEFASAFTDCSDEALACLSGPTNLLIPRSLQSGRWNKDAIDCVTNASSAGLRGVCRQLRGGASISYTFVRGRGLVSYQRLERSAWRPYVVRGRCGLFSALH
jgi:hypothetical protein